MDARDIDARVRRRIWVSNEHQPRARTRITVKGEGRPEELNGGALIDTVQASADVGARVGQDELVAVDLAEPPSEGAAASRQLLRIDVACRGPTSAPSSRPKSSQNMPMAVSDASAAPESAAA
jgi:hypothetical protein